MIQGRSCQVLPAPQRLAPLPPFPPSCFRPAGTTHNSEASTSAAAQRSRIPASQTSRRVATRAVAEENYATYGQDWSVPEDAYIVVGLAHCFKKNDNGKLEDCFVVEPLGAPSLECMMADGKTCYLEIKGLKLSQALSQSWSHLPDSWRTEHGASWCEDYVDRANAVARTWQRPHAQDNLMDIVPLGQTRGRFNFNLDEKRILNMENVVSDADNVKQDMSIDVYGRAEAAAEEEAKAAAAKKEEAKAVEEEEEEEDLDALLMA